MIESGNFLDTQHVKGDWNSTADWLTFEGDDRYKNNKLVENPIAYDCPSNNTLSHRFCICFPQDVPQPFLISHLPTENLSFAQSTMLIFKLSMIQKAKDNMNKRIESGDGGKSSSKAPSYCQTPLLEEYQQRMSSSLGRFSLRCSRNQILLSW